jgi:haloalkane dehalogenase
VDQAANAIEHRIPCGQGAVYARDYPGAGPAFVLMHGLPDNLRIYDQLVPLLVAAGRPVVTFDFLGFGASDKPDGARYSYAQQLADLEAVVAHLALDQVVLVPHDSSGFAGLNFALAHPQRTAAVYMLNSAYADAPDVHWPEMIELAARPSLRALSNAMLGAQFAWLLGWQQQMFAQALPPAQRANFQAHIGKVIEQNFTAQPGAGSAYAQLTAQFYDELAANRPRLPALAELDVPVRLIWGDYDPYLTLSMAQARLAHLRHGSLQSIPAGHWLQSDRPDEVARALLA